MNLKQIRILIGCIGWFAAIVSVTALLRAELSSTAHGPADVVRDVSRWVLHERTEFEAVAPIRLPMSTGDPVLVREADGSWRQVGVVRRTGGKDKKVHYTQRIAVSLYDHFTRAERDHLTLEYHSTPTTLDWVVKTMIPPEKQIQMADLIAASWAEHQQEVIEKLQPVMRESLSRAADAIEDQLSDVLKDHEADFAAVGDRYQREILQKELIPLVRAHILPLAMEEIEPVAAEVGEALWKKVSLWGFTWRYLYDVSPLPERNRVKEEFDRFLETAAIPELESRTDQFVATAERIVARASRDPNVRSAIRRNLRTIATDQELRKIVWQIIREAILENQQLLDSLEEYWRSREARQAFQVASGSFEPTVRKIGDMVFGTRDKGVSPEFAKVLRLQILTKDRRWLLLRTGAPSASDTHAPGEIPITVASEPMPFPITFEAPIQSPLTQSPVSREPGKVE